MDRRLAALKQDVEEGRLDKALKTTNDRELKNNPLVKASIPTDKDTLLNLEVVFRTVMDNSAIVRMYENALKSNSEDELYNLQLFHAYGRTREYEKQKIQAMKAYKATGNPECMVLAALSTHIVETQAQRDTAAPLSGLEPLVDAPESRNLRLAENMMRKAQADTSKWSDEALLVYLHTLRRMNQPGEALAALDAAEAAGAGTTSRARDVSDRMQQQALRQRLSPAETLEERIDLLCQMGAWRDAHASHRKFLRVYGRGRWAHYSGLVMTLLRVLQAGDCESSPGAAVANVLRPVRLEAAQVRTDPAEEAALADRATAEERSGEEDTKEESPMTEEDDSVAPSVASLRGFLRWMQRRELVDGVPQTRGPYMAEMYLEIRLLEATGGAAGSGADVELMEGVPASIASKLEGDPARPLVCMLANFFHRFGGLAVCQGDVRPFLRPFLDEAARNADVAAAGESDPTNLLEDRVTPVSSRGDSVRSGIPLSPLIDAFSRAGRFAAGDHVKCSTVPTRFSPIRSPNTGVNPNTDGGKDVCSFRVSEVARNVLVEDILMTTARENTPGTEWETEMQRLLQTLVDLVKNPPAESSGEGGEAPSIQQHQRGPHLSKEDAVKLTECRMQLQKHNMALVTLCRLGRLEAMAESPRELVDQLVTMWKRAHVLDAIGPVDREEVQPSGNLLLLAVDVLRRDAFAHLREARSGDRAYAVHAKEARNRFWEAIVLLERALVDFPHNFHLRLYLIRFLTWMGGTMLVQHQLGVLQMKHVQTESLSYLFLPHLLRLGGYTEVQAACTDITDFHLRGSSDFPTYARSALVEGNYSKQLEMVYMQERLNHSLQLNEARSILGFITLPTDSLDETLNHLRGLMVTSEVPDHYVELSKEEMEDQLVCNQDEEVMFHLQPPTSFATDTVRRRARRMHTIWQIEQRRQFLACLLWALMDQPRAVRDRMDKFRHALAARNAICPRGVDAAAEIARMYGHQNLSAAQQAVLADVCVSAEESDPAPVCPDEMADLLTIMSDGPTHERPALRWAMWGTALLTLHAAVDALEAAEGTDGAASWESVAASVRRLAAVPGPFIEALIAGMWDVSVEGDATGKSAAAASGDGSDVPVSHAESRPLRPAFLVECATFIGEGLAFVATLLALIAKKAPRPKKTKGKKRGKGGGGKSAAAAESPLLVALREAQSAWTSALQKLSRAMKEPVGKHRGGRQAPEELQAQMGFDPKNCWSRWVAEEDHGDLFSRILAQMQESHMDSIHRFDLTLSQRSSMIRSMRLG